MKIMSIFGTRPEAIKMAPVIRELEKHTEKIQSLVCVTAQHREMLDGVLRTFGIWPDYDLNLMKQGQTPASVTAAVLEELTPVLQKEKPSMVLVHGDTTTAFAAALTAFYEKIPVGHVEAGLRTYDLSAPYPEEANRHLTAVLAALHFAPTKQAEENLIREGCDPVRITVTGNTAIDALRMTGDKAAGGEFTMWAKGGRILLLTLHRRENQGEPLKRVFQAVRQLTETYEDLRVIYPCHRNPAIRREARDMFAGNERVRLTDALDVAEFHALMKSCYLILTDSGGIQEEGPGFGKPVLVARNRTERPEGVKAGTVKLVGTDTENIVKEVSLLLENKSAYEAMAKAVNPYGDGRAAPRIVEGLLRYLEAKAS